MSHQKKFVTIEEVEQLRKQPGVLLIDVRTRGEFEEVHIPEARNIPVNEITEHAEELAAHRERIIIHCRTTNRAKLAQMLLRAAGIENVEVMDGGMVAWQKKNLEVVRGEPRPSFFQRFRF